MIFDLLIGCGLLIVGVVLLILRYRNAEKADNENESMARYNLVGLAIILIFLGLYFLI